MAALVTRPFDMAGPDAFQMPNPGADPLLAFNALSMNPNGFNVQPMPPQRIVHQMALNNYEQQLMLENQAQTLMQQPIFANGPASEIIDNMSLPALSQAASMQGGSPMSQIITPPSLDGSYNPQFVNAFDGEFQQVNDEYGAMGMPYGAYPGYPNQTFSRTVYVGNLPSDAAVDELLSLVRFGPIESVKIVPDKGCAFISFLDPHIAAAFHSDVQMRKTQLHGQELKVGWGKFSPIPTNVLVAVQQYAASRNVYVGGLDQSTTEQDLRDDLSRFGLIDQVKIVRDKNIGFVHFLSIGTAMKVVVTLPQEPAWRGKRVSYGKDRCAYVPKSHQAQQQHNLQAFATAAAYTGNMGNIAASLNAGMMNSLVMQNGMENSILAQAGNRCVYLGNLHPDTTVEEICNSVRGGVLQSIKYLADKHICFVTFVDPNAALAFYSATVEHNVSIHNRRLKIGWGKPSGPTPPGIAMCVQSGGSRNVYIGGIDSLDVFTEDKIRQDFSAYGEIELINILREKNCGFVNFTNISNAIKCIENIKHDPQYANFKLAFGKDRCANANQQGRFFAQKRRPRQEAGQENETSAPTEVEDSHNTLSNTE